MDPSKLSSVLKLFVFGSVYHPSNWCSILPQRVCNAECQNLLSKQTKTIQLLVNCRKTVRNLLSSRIFTDCRLKFKYFSSTFQYYQGPHPVIRFQVLLRTLIFFCKFKHFQGFLKHTMNPGVSAIWVNFKEVVSEMDIQSRASPCRIRAERRSHRPAQRGSRNRWSTRRGWMDGRMQEAYDGRKVLSGGADGHTIQCCLPIVTSPTPHNVLQYIVQCQLWCHHTIMIIQKKKSILHTQ